MDMDKRISHRFKPGDRVRFPTEEELEKLSWTYDSINDVFRSPETRVCVTQEMLHIMAGKEVEITATSVYPGCYFGTGHFTWPLDFTCIDSYISHRPNHTCLRGQTPIGDFWICKICGRDMERFR